MNNKSGNLYGILATAIIGFLFSVNLSVAQIASRSKDVVVVTPASMPKDTQQRGNAFALYSDGGDGSSYLYIEQNQGENLLVLNVTDPAHVKQVATMTLAVPAPYEFLGPISHSTYLVRFYNGDGMAVLDLRKPKAPSLKRLNAFQNGSQIESLGRSAFLLASAEPLDIQHNARDYQVVDTSNPIDPTLLYTARQVSATLTCEETGTTFLLGSEGLTIIRRPQVEEKYRSELSYTN